MTAVDGCLQELADNLHVRGVVRRRFLRECAEHLRDAAAVGGEEAAVRAFGDVAAIAAEFDADVAVRRGTRATAVVILGVTAVAGSTLTLIHSATPAAEAPGPVAAAFFLCAQISAVALALATLQALAMRRSAGPTAGSDLLLLARRNAGALIASALTMLAAGVALPGQGSAPALLAGPLLAGAASVAVLRARWLTRQINHARGRVFRSPLDDLASATGISVPALTPQGLLALVTALAAAGAALRDHLEHAALLQATATGTLEAVAVLTAYALLGGQLGIRPRTGNA